MQGVVHILHADHSLFHRAKHLDVHRLDCRVRRDAACDHIGDRREDVLGVGLVVKEKVAAAIIDDGHLAGVDAVGVLDDETVVTLAVYLREIADRDDPARDHVGEHVARADGRQLVLVADHDQSAAELDRLDERVEHIVVAHADLVDDDDVLLKFGGLVEHELALAVRKVEVEQPVYRLRLHAGGLGEALCRPARRRAQADGIVAAAQQMYDALDDRCLAGAGAAGDDVDALHQTAADRLRLRWVKFDLVELFVEGNLFVGVERQTVCVVEHRPDVGRDRLFAHIVAGEHVDGLAVLFKPDDLAGDLAVLNHIADQRLRVERVEAQQRIDLGDELVLGKVGVAVLVRRLFEDVDDRGGDSKAAVGRDANLSCDLVRGQKTDAVDVVDQLVGVRLDDLCGGLVVRLEDLDREVERDAVVLEIDDRVLHLFEREHGLLDRERLFERDALDLGKARGLMLDDVERLGAELLDDRICGHLADAFEQSA